MTYFELLRVAEHRLDNNEINFGEYVKLIKPLKQEIHENVHGEWLGEYEGEIDGTHHCSVCDGWVVWDDINYAYTYNFCPWCGADMRRKEE